MTKRYPMASKVKIPQTYRPSYDTDIRATIKAERKRIAASSVVVEMPALVVDHVGIYKGTFSSPVVQLQNIPKRRGTK